MIKQVDTVKELIEILQEIPEDTCIVGPYLSSLEVFYSSSNPLVQVIPKQP